MFLSTFLPCVIMISRSNMFIFTIPLCCSQNWSCCFTNIKWESRVCRLPAHSPTRLGLWVIKISQLTSVLDASQPQCAPYVCDGHACSQALCQHLTARSDLVSGSWVSALRILTPSAPVVLVTSEPMLAWRGAVRAAPLPFARLHATAKPVCQQAYHPLTVLSK